MIICSIVQFVGEAFSSKNLKNSVVDQNIAPTGKKKHQNKKFLSHFNESLSDCVIDNSTQGGLTEVEIVGAQNDYFVNNFESATLCENGASEIHVIESNIANRVRREVTSVVAVVEN